MTTTTQLFLLIHEYQEYPNNKNLIKDKKTRNMAVHNNTDLEISIVVFLSLLASVVFSRFKLVLTY